MAVVKDPAAAVVCLWTARKHIGAEIIDEPGALCWNELLTSDTAGAEAFYTKIFGWTTQPVDMGPAGIYTLFKRPGAARDVAGMMALPPAMQGVPPHWLGYFAVANCDESTMRAGKLGGSVMVPPSDIPNVGRCAGIADPQGAKFALFMRRA